MALKVAIVGLPNVGKSTLFNALTQTAAAQAANYPFCTIEPNTGDVAVPEPRLEALAKIIPSKEIIPARINFVDIAGLVRGASKGEGLGNQFLANIRDCDAIAFVARCFVDDDVTHVEGKVDPLADLDTIETELMLADLESLEKRVVNLEKRAKTGDKDSAQTLRLVPAGGYVPLAQDPLKHFTLLAMPALAIGLGLASSVFRMTRAAVLDVSQRDFVRTARAKGVAPARILIRHVLRNALMPVITVLALNLGTLLGGTVLVEYVFNYPGLSGLLVDAVNARDYPEVQGVVLVISVLFVGLNLAVDLLYAVIDPRVRHA